MRILYRHDGTAWVDLREQPWRTELEPQEQEVLAAFSAALPDVLDRIDLADGIGFFTLTSSGKWIYDDRPTMFAEYGWCSDVQSPLPW
jgi:hypothetical protein